MDRRSGNVEGKVGLSVCNEATRVRLFNKEIRFYGSTNSESGLV